MGVAVAVWLDLAGGEGRLRLVAPAGMELTAEAPAEVALRSDLGSRSVVAMGADLDGGLALGRVAGRVEAELTAVLCTKSDGLCQRLSWSVSGDVGAARRGRFALTPASAHQDVFQQAADGVADAVFAAARARGRPVLLDFSAVWCPPCNRLGAEVLHADPLPSLLEGLEVGVIDADDTSSWGLKNRYVVTAYPTVLVVDPDGTERARLLGYPGRDAFLAWVAAAIEGPSEASRIGAGPEASSPAEAARLADALTKRNQDASAFLRRAEQGDPDDPALRAARFRAEHGLADLGWLVAHRPVAEWLGDAVSWGKPEAGPVVLPALRRALPAASGLDAVDLLDALRVYDPERATQHAAAAAALLRTTLSGDPERDKGFLTDLATFMEAAGDVDGGLAVLDAASAARPEDPTFVLGAARMANRAGRWQQALERADVALQLAWGDNRLRVAAARAEALAGLGRTEAASAFARQILDEAPAPAEGLAVRTHRYRADLARWVVVTAP